MTHSDERLGTLIDSKNAALLVIDMQEKLLPAIDKHKKVEKRVVQAVQVAGHLGLPIVVTEQYVKGLGATVPNVVAALEQFDAYAPIEKISFSCFGEPQFVESLAHKKIDTLIICGIESHICTLQTALAALDKQFDVFVIAEATGSRNSVHKKEAMHRLRQEGAVVGSVEMFAFELLCSAKHPAFKMVQKVIM